MRILRGAYAEHRAVDTDILRDNIRSRQGFQRRNTTQIGPNNTRVSGWLYRFKMQLNGTSIIA